MKGTRHMDAAMFNLGGLVGAAAMWALSDYHLVARWEVIGLFGALWIWNSWAWVRSQRGSR